MRLQPRVDARQWFRRYALRGTMLGLAVGALAFAAPTFAQDAARVAAGIKVWEKAGCSECHSDFGVGGGGGAAVAGPNLRRSRLDRDALAETISCGRPGKGMPGWLIGAYTAKACSGRPLGPPPADAQLVPVLDAGELQALLDYLQARVVGKGNVTREECLEFHGNPAPCGGYR